MSIPPIGGDYLRMRDAVVVHGVRGVEGVQNEVKRKRKHQINFLEYNQSAQKLTLQISVTRFANSKKVGGASVGKPPENISGEVKYVLGKGYVSKETPIPTPKQLQEQFARPTWNHW